MSPLEALASPVRLEIVTALADGESTVRELAARLGRTRQALYHHLTVLERAGLIEVSGWEGRGRRRQRRYAARPDRLEVAARARRPAEVAAVRKAIGSVLRMTGREVDGALASGDFVRTGAARELVAARGKARLDGDRLARVNALLDEIMEEMRTARRGPRTGRLYALTLVLTPSPDAGGGDSTKGDR